MKTPRDIVGALFPVVAAIIDLAAALDAYQRGGLRREEAVYWLATAVDRFGDTWEHYLRTYGAAQEAALSQGGFDAVNNLTDHLGLEIVTSALRDRMVAAGLGFLVQTTPQELGQLKVTGGGSQAVGSETVQ